MLAHANTGSILGIDALPVTVEAHRANGLPGLTLIGLARGAVRESTVRVRSAIMAAGLPFGLHRLVVNLLPAELPKEASALDLALALALIASHGGVPQAALRSRRFFGELSLGGELQPTRGAVLLADLARRAGDAELVVPRACAAAAAVIPGIRVVGADDLAAVVAHLRGTRVLPLALPAATVAPADASCLADVHGQARAKRALVLAAAGNHNLLMIGPPGSGKTMLARRLPGLLPPLAAEARIEASRIHSAAGVLAAGLMAAPPFRAPHHSASEAALCGGGGGTPRPGEVTLAHHGVLFLDELPEFNRRALESLREPLEEGAIQIARSRLSLRFPARVLLVAAMNPCPCGYFRPGTGVGPPAACVCAYEQVQRYRARISGPLRDRIDLHVGVDPVPFAAFAAGGRHGRSSADWRPLIAAARQRQAARLGPGRTNASMTAAELQVHVPLTAALLAPLERAAAEHRLSSRALARVLRVARTAADLAAASADAAASAAPASRADGTASTDMAASTGMAAGADMAASTDTAAGTVGAAGTVASSSDVADTVTAAHVEEALGLRLLQN